MRLKAGGSGADQGGMTGGTGYDPKIIERFADQLLRKADTVRVGCAVGGGIFGVFVGAVPLTPLKSLWGVPAGFGVATIIVGALLGILVGYVIGEGRAFRYRVQAQSAIFQLEIERRVSSAVAEAVASVAVQHVQPAPTAPSPPVHADEPTPPTMPPLSPVSVAPRPVPEPEPEPQPTREADRDPGPVHGDPPLLRPPGLPAPPLSPRFDEPPLSPAVDG
jgi:hypothetical protein